VLLASLAANSVFAIPRDTEAGEKSVASKRAPSEKPGTLFELAKTVEPWVVAIRVDRKKDVVVPRDELPFGGAGALQGAPGETKDYFKRPKGWATGILIDPAGFVVTTHYNVLGDIRSIHVKVAGGAERAAKIVARGPLDDIALLKIEGDEPVVSKKRWKSVPWSKKRVRAGQFVFALGRSPDPGRMTITEGVVSALGRNGGRVMQVDAKLNYGNVGGPLVDLDGKIVGVSAFVGHTYPQWGFNSGIGFATTARTVEDILPKLKKGEDVSAFDIPFLGVQSEPVSPDVEGAPVLMVVPGYSAERAGVRKGDVIIEYNGKPLNNFGQLRYQIFSARIGDEVTFKIRRGEEVLELKGKLMRRSPRT